MKKKWLETDGSYAKKKKFIKRHYKMFKNHTLDDAKLLWAIKMDFNNVLKKDSK